MDKTIKKTKGLAIIGVTKNLNVTPTKACP